jgi:hypothetical protein
MAHVNSGAPSRVLLIGSQDTAGNITGVASGSSHTSVNCEGYTNPVIYITASAACSAGTVLIEERDRPQDSAGLIATVTLSSPFASAGGTYAYHLQTAAYGYVSARIGTSVTGAVVSAVLRMC